MESSHRGQALKEAKEAQENETRRAEPSRAASTINTLAMENIRSVGLGLSTLSMYYSSTYCANKVPVPWFGCNEVLHWEDNQPPPPRPLHHRPTIEPHGVAQLTSFDLHVSLALRQ